MSKVFELLSEVWHVKKGLVRVCLDSDHDFEGMPPGLCLQVGIQLSKMKFPMD